MPNNKTINFSLHFLPIYAGVNKMHYISVKKLKYVDSFDNYEQEVGSKHTLEEVKHVDSISYST